MGKGRKAGIVNAVLGIDIKKFSTGLQNAKRQMKGASAKFAEYGKVIAGVGIGIGAFAVSVAREYENLNVRLKTAFQGNEQAARNAFETINEFTKKTPFQLNEVADAFIKLKNMGLNPSMEALNSYGNTAAAMGKSLNQMIEAVADAATGEFERLKEFGIKARSEGDKVKFTFRGVTTTIGKNAAEIQDYLLNIGNTDFAGGILEASQTLDGQLSTLRDTVKGFANDMGQILLPQIKDAVGWVQKLADKVNEYRKLIETRRPINELGEAQRAITAAKNRRSREFPYADAEELVPTMGEAYQKKWKELTKDIENAELAYQNLIAKREESNNVIEEEAEAVGNVTSKYDELYAKEIERMEQAALKARVRRDIAARAIRGGKIGAMQGVGMSGGFGGLENLGTPLDAVPEKIEQVAEHFKSLNEVVHETVGQMNQMLNSFVTGGLTFFSQKLGEALAGGGFKNGELGQGILDMTGQFMQTLGSLMITTGVSLEAFKKGLETVNPALLIGGGVALIAAGAAVSHFAQNGYGNNTTGGASTSGFGGRDSGGRTRIEVDGRLRGGDIVLLQSEYNRRR